MAKQGRLLDPPMEERDLVRCLRRHFDKEVSREIRPSVIHSIKEMVILLNEIEDEQRINVEKRREIKFRDDETKYTRSTQRPTTSRLNSDNRQASAKNYYQEDRKYMPVQNASRYTSNAKGFPSVGTTTKQQSERNKWKPLPQIKYYENKTEPGFQKQQQYQRKTGNYKEHGENTYYRNNRYNNYNNRKSNVIITEVESEDEDRYDKKAPKVKATTKPTNNEAQNGTRTL